MENWIKVINEQIIIQILIAFYIYGNIRLKEISILNSFEQIQENTISGSAFPARLGSSAVAFIPDLAQVLNTHVQGLQQVLNTHVVFAVSECV